MKTLAEMRERMAQVIAKLEELNGAENVLDFVNEIEVLSNEFEALKKGIEAKEKMETQLASTQASTRKTAPEASIPRIEVQASRTEKTGGFKSFGEYINAVKKSSTGEMDKRFVNTMTEGVNADGGFAVPEEFGSEINTTLLTSDESLFAKTNQIKVSSNNITIPKSETQPWNGGVTAYWTAEGAAITDSKGVLGQASFKLNKLAAMVKVTDELLEDGLALESYIKKHAPLAIMHKINEAIISGDGVAKPTGFLSSGFGVTVLKEVGQAADTVVAKNVIKMFTRLIPAARRGAAWYINAQVEEQLLTMKDDNGNYIYLAPGSQMNNSPYGMLLGLPVIPMMGGLSALGTKGDICLINLDYYWTISKGGVKSSVSSHLFFDRDIQAFKFTVRLDGKCPFSAPVTTQNGAHQMSAIVLLEDRA